MADTPLWLQALDAANKAVTSAAIIVGGMWAYFKFVKGRVYRPRLELKVAAKAFQRGGQDYLLANVTLNNVGLSRVEIKQEGTALRVFCAPLAAASAPRTAEWERIATLSVLAAHAWIESGEAIEDTLLIHLPPEQLAAKLELRIVGQKLEWNAKSIVRLGVEPGTASQPRRPGKGGKDDVDS